MRSEATIRARVVFMKSMAKRRFEARISINHVDEELLMGVVASKSATQGPSTAAMDSRGTQYKSALVLSGGERSFSTVSLLLALWESAGGPLRCLDEWDVFLDHVNRDLAAEMLVSVQCVFP
jgi:structural maintenance of chromosomes protein 6